MASTLQKHGYPHALALLLPRRCGITAMALPLIVRPIGRVRAPPLRALPPRGGGRYRQFADSAQVPDHHPNIALGPCSSLIFAMFSALARFVVVAKRPHHPAKSTRGAWLLLWLWVGGHLFCVSSPSRRLWFGDTPYTISAPANAGVWALRARSGSLRSPFTPGNNRRRRTPAGHNKNTFLYYILPLKL